MPGLSFQVPDPPEDDEREPLWFTLSGKHRRTKKPWTERFDIVPHIPFAVLNDLAGTIQAGPDGEVIYTKHGVLRFMHAVIEPDDVPRWDALVRDADRPVDLEVVTTAMQAIVGASSNRPTGPQSNSPRGSAGTNGGRKASSARKAAKKSPGKGGTRGRGSTSR
jgi:hypothetical protein